MMKHSNFFSYFLLLALMAFAFPCTLQAEELINHSSNVFKFQQKLAMNGNVHAQYKLGTMYETGEGVETNIEQAKHWYGLAANAGSTSAQQRNTYLLIKEQGYDQAKNAEWLDGVITEANARKPEAVLLLGQLYREGLGVKKDLNKSLELLNQVKILGVGNVEKEIAMVRKEIEALKNGAQIKQQKRQLARARLQQKKKEQQIEQQHAEQKKQQAIKEKQVNKEKLAEAAALSKAEKRKKYEEVMRKIKLEQQLIDKQQSAVTGNDNTPIDDEI